MYNYRDKPENVSFAQDMYELFYGDDIMMGEGFFIINLFWI